jgi:2-haloacid dehalogenase
MEPAVPSICVFDVNETLSTSNSSRRYFNDCLAIGTSCASGLAARPLFGCNNLVGPYTTFFTLGQGVEMLGTIHKVSITEADVDELRTRMLTMPAHADVPAGLDN